ncbi:hypothetical protein [Cellulomonas cellasea]|uniref:Uncharacterized protein n=1 Tax=Cellulomonas cellasea TaxID=43670 RepID=A0A7W4UGG2_9CELL|nr:hypothetical protein [Cellulomonas cellasea]MBB2923728.1 hypothetical protein [Cellulomonas cellasea]
MSRKRHAALAGTCLALIAALGGCTGGTGGAGDTGATQSSGSGASAPATSEDEAVLPGDEGGTVTPNSESSPEAAEAYLECLTDAGVGAAIVDGTRVVLAADVDGGSASSAEDVTAAEEQCRTQVPEYQEPDFDER